MKETKDTRKHYVITKRVTASSVQDALRREKKTPVDSVVIDESAVAGKSMVGFSA